MKKLIIAGILLFAVAVCKSPQKLLQEGNYDAAIDRSIKKILKDKADNEDKTLLEKAYILANQRDLDRINLLKTEGRPENWEEIYQLYSALNSRQAEIQKVLPLEIQGKQFQYKHVDYNSAIVEAKTKAADYFYKNGKILMRQKNKESYREAFYGFLKAKEYRGSAYLDIEQLINDSRYLGTSRVLVELINQTPINLPPNFYDRILNINTSGLNSTWIEYDFNCSKSENEYDYFVSLVIQFITVSPDDYFSKEYLRRKTIQDGFQYKLDRRGNVMKDSLGNDIKAPKYKDISCTVIEIKQMKSASIQGEVEFVAANPEQLINKEPVAANAHFEHFSGKAVGDIRALEPEDMHLIEMHYIPYPDDLSMIYDCTEILCRALSDILYNNRRLIR